MDAEQWEAVWRNATRRHARMLLNRAVEEGEHTEALVGLLRSSFPPGEPSEREEPPLEVVEVPDEGIDFPAPQRTYDDVFGVGFLEPPEAPEDAPSGFEDLLGL